MMKPVMNFFIDMKPLELQEKIHSILDDKEQKLKQMNDFLLSEYIYRITEVYRDEIDN